MNFRNFMKGPIEEIFKIGDEEHKITGYSRANIEAQKEKIRAAKKQDFLNRRLSKIGGKTIDMDNLVSGYAGRSVKGKSVKETVEKYKERYKNKSIAITNFIPVYWVDESAKNPENIDEIIRLFEFSETPVKSLPASGNAGITLDEASEMFKARNTVRQKQYDRFFEEIQNIKSESNEHFKSLPSSSNVKQLTPYEWLVKNHATLNYNWRYASLDTDGFLFLSCQRIPWSDGLGWYNHNQYLGAWVYELIFDKPKPGDTICWSICEKHIIPKSLLGHYGDICVLPF